MLAPDLERRPEPEPAAWVGLGELHLPRFLAFTSALYFSEAAVQHPLSVLKTRLQASSSAQASSGGSLAALLTARRVLGLRGLYTLFLPATLAALPSELAYVGGLEAARQALQPGQQHLAELLGGTPPLSRTPSSFALALSHRKTPPRLPATSPPRRCACAVPLTSTAGPLLSRSLQLPICTLAFSMDTTPSASFPFTVHASRVMHARSWASTPCSPQPESRQRSPQSWR